MQNYTKVYFKYFNLTIADFVPCEICSAPGVDIHHVNGRGPGKDVITNLMALCRACHTAAHSGAKKETLQNIHNKFIGKHVV